jgi:uncharacterized membrane protein
MAEGKKKGLQVKRYLISGIVTIIPLFVTWLVIDFTFRQLAKAGTPVVRTISTTIQDDAPVLAKLLLQSWFQDGLGVCIVLVGLYVLGWAVNRVVGRRLMKAFESLVDRVPVVKAVYGSVRKLIASLQTKPGDAHRVVLVEFPNENMKTVGLVTRTITDADNGQELAAVYVPTTPNPTSGYLEIVPVSRLVPTDWTLDEAMTFVVSGGAVAPERLSFSRNGDGKTQHQTQENSL